MNCGKVLVLDGGFSNELNKYLSFNVHEEPLWTAKALLEETDAIIKTHEVYLEAGADVIETSTFQATVPGFSKYHDVSEEKSVELIRQSVLLAKQAVENYRKSSNDSSKDRRIQIGGSIGPYGAFLRDGSEYSGRYMDTVSNEELDLVHIPRIRALISGGVDLLNVETFPSVVEVLRILDFVEKEYPSVEVWVNLSVNGDDSQKTPRNESFTDAFCKVAKYPQVTGFGINCCKPDHVLEFIQSVVPLKKELSRDVQIVVYPNSGDDWIQGVGWVKKDIPTVDAYATSWMEAGANVIGGCCEIGPEGISKLRAVVNSWNAKLP